MKTYDAVLRKAVTDYFPELLEDLTEFAWLYIKAQMWQESRFDRFAVSKAGAMGLMQLMPATAAELGVTDPFNVEQNIRGGVQHLAKQYRHLGEIPTYLDRLKMAFASYNGGRGYINVALALARRGTDLPYGYRGWVKAGRPAGVWQKWQYAAWYLADERCLVRGRHPDHKQMTDYVDRIIERFTYYLQSAI